MRARRLSVGGCAMAQPVQFYGDGGVPLHVQGDVEDPAVAWRSHRARVRGWLDAVPNQKWSGPTRCGLWDVTALVQHMTSASQFLGYTLHQAAQGIATDLPVSYTHLTLPTKRIV